MDPVALTLVDEGALLYSAPLPSAPSPPAGLVFITLSFLPFSTDHDALFLVHRLRIVNAEIVFLGGNAREHLLLSSLEHRPS